jgi:hypothetical protein
MIEEKGVTNVSPGLSCQLRITMRGGRQYTIDLRSWLDEGGQQRASLNDPKIFHSGYKINGGFEWPHGDLLMWHQISQMLKDHCGIE